MIDSFWIPYKKVSGCICLPLPKVELGPPKIAIFWNIIMFKNGEVDPCWSWALLKICIIYKNASSKSCWALNSVKKSQWVHIRFLQNFPKIFNQSLLGKLTKILPKFLGEISRVSGRCSLTFQEFLNILLLNFKALNGNIWEQWF